MPQYETYNFRDVYNCLKGLAGEEIILPEEVSKGAKRCIDRMLELN